MTDSNSKACVACGQKTAGRFCASCGAAQGPATCAQCGHPVPATTRLTPVTMVGGVLLLLFTFLAGQQLGSRTNTSADAVPEAGGAPFAGGATRAPDISNLTPEEAAARLFDRVMRYSEEGKKDSVQMFAPMALLAYERVGSPDAHTRFDMGTIAIAMEDAPTAGAYADSILKSQPTHLLGLVLAMRAAELRRDGAAVSRYRSQLVAAERSEMAKGLKEYTDHQREVDRALGRSAPASGRDD